MSKVKHPDGIEISKYDKAQPYRVWFQGFIAGFRETEAEAKALLNKVKKGEKEDGRTKSTRYGKRNCPSESQT